MASTPLIRVFPAVLAVVIAVAVLPTAPAVAAPDPTQTTAVAARACVAAMQRYPLDDEVDIALLVRVDAWRESASGTVTGTTEETGWGTTTAQAAALQIALTWMSAESVRALNTLDADDLRSAEDDLVWAAGNLSDRRLAKVLIRPLADRTATIARLRDTAAKKLLESRAAAKKTSAKTSATTPVTTPVTVIDTRPDVVADDLVDFQRRLHTAMRALPAVVQEDLQDLRDAKTVHGLGAVGALLVWTQQQGQRGQELFNTWDGAGAAYAAALRSVVAGTAGVNTYSGVLDGCVRTLRAGSDDDGLTVKGARTLARSNVALRLDAKGVIRAVTE